MTNPPIATVVIDGESVPATLAPTDRQFRGAWQLEGEVITIDIAAARCIHRDLLREARRPMLVALDALWFAADETNDAGAKASIAAQKQALRDVTEDPRIEAAATPEALAALTIDVLLDQEG